MFFSKFFGEQHESPRTSPGEGMELSILRDGELMTSELMTGELMTGELMTGVHSPIPQSLISASVWQASEGVIL